MVGTLRTGVVAGAAVVCAAGVCMAQEAGATASPGHGHMTYILGAAVASLVAVLVTCLAWRRVLRRRIGERTEELARVNAELGGHRRRLEHIVEERTEELRESEEQHRSLAENLPDIVMRFDRECRHVYVSPAVLSATDLDPGEFIGKTIRQVRFDRENAAVREEHVRAVLMTGKPSTAELRGGGGGVMDWRFIPELDSDGDVRAVLSIARDVTDQAAAKDDFQSLFERMLDGFAIHEIITDADGKPVDYRFLAINPAFEELTGLHREDIEGKRVLEALPGTEDYWIQRYGRVALTGRPDRFENYAKALDKWFEVLAYRPKERQFACIFRDVTDRRHLEERLRHGEKMEAVGQLAGGVAHDFNNQLTGIMGYANMLRERIEDPDLRQYAENVLIAGRRATDLTRQLLAFARKGQYQNVVVNMHDAVHEVVAMLEHSIDKRIAISQHLAAKPCTALGDPTQLQNALLNLGLNARDAMPEGGELIFETGIVELDSAQCATMRAEIPPGQYLCISVSDTGWGMDRAIMDRVFEPFFTTKERDKGTGMGLAAVYGTVKNHGGAVTVESGVGRGSVFRVFLPACEPGDPEGSAAEQAEAAAPSARILVVDDEEMIRRLITEMLKSAGHHVETREDGAAAVEYYRPRWRDIDLVVLDLVMPRMSGAEAFEAMKAINPRVPVLLVSGFSVESEARALLEAGAAGFLQKPFDRGQLLAKVSEALGPADG